jgi:hypothetical protein
MIRESDVRCSLECLDGVRSDFEQALCRDDKYCRGELYFTGCGELIDRWTWETKTKNLPDP